MSKYEKFLSAAFLILFMGSAYWFFYSRKTIDTLDARIGTLNYNFQHLKTINKTLNDSYIFKEQFKEDYYITQLDREMNLMLMTIAALVAGFGVITFVNFEARLTSFKSNNEKRHIENEQKYHDLKDELMKLDAEKNLEMFMSLTAQASLFKPDTNAPTIVSLNLLALSCSAQHDLWVKTQDKVIDIDFYKNFFLTINSLVDKHSVKSSNSFKIAKRTSEYIRKLEIDELNELMAEINVKLKPIEVK